MRNKLGVLGVLNQIIENGGYLKIDDPIMIQHYLDNIIMLNNKVYEILTQLVKSKEYRCNDLGELVLIRDNFIDCEFAKYQGGDL